MENLKDEISSVTKGAFFSALVFGLLAHMVPMTGDFPNHDGLGSLYFNQDMLSSGRWFLSIACGISSYFALPWLIGVLSVLYIGIAAALTCSVLKIRNKYSAIVIGALMATFPALASTFAYVFTMDGYMLGLLMAVAAVYFTKKFWFGWIGGAVLLALSLGTYQAYLPVAVILSMYAALLILMGEDRRIATSKTSGSSDEAAGTEERDSAKTKILKILRFLYMGLLGGGLYFVILKVLLKVRGLELASYQGADSINLGAAQEASQSAGPAGAGLISKIVSAYKDFAVFSVKSKVLAPNVFVWIALGVLTGAALMLLLREIVKKKWYKSPVLYIAIILIALIYPVASNVVMIVMGDVTYHAIMRYQWVLIPIILIAICDLLAYKPEYYAVKEGRESFVKLVTWLIPILGCLIAFCYIVTDNIGYSNLQKKYERTYAYCERLLDRIEQTDGYYPGIPIAMIGVVSEDQYPKADLTEGVTDNLIGLSGDYLCYKGADYKHFFKAYLGADLNIISGEEIGEIYNSEEYVLMDSFPGKTSVKLVDGTIYVKTENIDYGLREKYGE